MTAAEETVVAHALASLRPDLSAADDKYQQWLDVVWQTVERLDSINVESFNRGRFIDECFAPK